MGHKRVWPYRFDAQERALMERHERCRFFCSFSGLADFPAKDALATALHVYFISTGNILGRRSCLFASCPYLPPTVNNDKINPKRRFRRKRAVRFSALHRIFPSISRRHHCFQPGEALLSEVGITQQLKFRHGVSAGIQDVEEKYERGRRRCRRWAVWDQWWPFFCQHVWKIWKGRSSAGAEWLHYVNKAAKQWDR